jgi:hypothetical protein
MVAPTFVAANRLGGSSKAMRVSAMIQSPNDN